MPSPPLTRRQLLRGAAAGIATAAAGAQASAVASAITRQDPPGPYPDAVLPPGIRSRFVADINGLRMHVLEAGARGGGARWRSPAPRLPRTRLQLAASDAGARRRGVSRPGARSARLRPHRRHRRALRRRTAPVPDAERGAGHALVGVGVRLPRGPPRRPRLRIAGGVVVRRRSPPTSFAPSS